MVLGKYMFTLNFCGFREKENNTAQLMWVDVLSETDGNNGPKRKVKFRTAPHYIIRSVLG